MPPAKCLDCGDSPLLRPGCPACGGSGKRGGARQKRAKAALDAGRPIPGTAVPPRADRSAPPLSDADFLGALPEDFLSPAELAQRGGFSSLPPQPGPFEGPLEALQKVWGYESFRPGQREVIDAVMGGEDVIAIAPTGRGKSACMQVPALLRRDRPVLVVSPLIALMGDQVQQARARGIPAVAVTSQLGAAEQRQALRDVARACLVYAAPERLDSGRFLGAFAGRAPWLVALDEVHEVDAAGLSYRPAYRFVEEFLRGMAERPQWLALTASATADTVADLRQRLGLQGARLFRFGCDRPNLRYRVERCSKGSKTSRVLQLVQRRGEGAAIVYTLSRKDAEAVAAYLRREGVPARHYHAGMKPPERREVEGLFFGKELDVVVATCAFGMGIDRSDVRLVVMHGMPKSVEDYYQSMGRAGRDGAPSDCVALFDSSQDYNARRWLINNTDDLDKNQWTQERGWAEAKFAESRARQMRLLDGVDGFLRSGCCRAQLLRTYFSEAAGQPCGTCDNCVARR